MPSSLPIVTIFGATGAQGGSVLRALLATDKYHIRAVTRNPNDDKAKKLLENTNNVELVRADLNDKSSVKSAVKGSWAVFGVTNFWQPEILNDHKKEIEQGTHLIDAVDEEKVPYLILSTLPGVHEQSGGKLKVPHLDNKWHLEKYAKTKTHTKNIFFMASTYNQNFLSMMGPQKTPNGLAISLPVPADMVWDLFDVTDSGEYIKAVLENPDKYVNKDIKTTGERLTSQQIVDTFSRISGQSVQFNSISREEYVKYLPHNIADEFYQMLKWFEEYGLYGKNTENYVSKEQLGIKNIHTLEQTLRQGNWKPPQ
jgi:uncharacterized protein YbjT (DUF2867 family)